MPRKESEAVPGGNDRIPQDAGKIISISKHSELQARTTYRLQTYRFRKIHIRAAICSSTFQCRGLGLWLWLAHARNALAISGLVMTDSHIRLPTRGRYRGNSSLPPGSPSFLGP